MYHWENKIYFPPTKTSLHSVNIYHNNILLEAFIIANIRWKYNIRFLEKKKKYFFNCNFLKKKKKEVYLVETYHLSLIDINILSKLVKSIKIVNIYQEITYKVFQYTKASLITIKYLTYKMYLKITYCFWYR